MKITIEKVVYKLHSFWSIVSIWLKIWIYSLKTSLKKISTYKRESKFFGNLWEFLGSGLGIFREFFWNFLGVLLEFFWNSYDTFWDVWLEGSDLGIFCEIFENSWGFLWEFYRNSFGILFILTQSCECDMNWCNFWQGETRTRTGQDRTTNQILRSSLARSHLKSPILILYC